MPITNDALLAVADHVGGTELTNNSAPKAIGHESDFVKEQIVRALQKDSRLEPVDDIRVSVTDDEILLTAPWVDAERPALAESIARALAVGRTVRFETRQ